MPVFVYWIWIYAFLFRSTLNRKLNSELVCLAPLGPQVNNLYCTRSRTRFHNHGLCKMLQIKCHVNINRMISVVCCIGVPMVYALTSRPVSYPDWLETNIECRLLNMQIWWCLTNFAVRDRTVGAMVWQIWHEPSVNLYRHYKTGSAFYGELHRLGYRWHYCVNSLSLMVLHTRFLTFCCVSTSTYLYKKQSDN